MLLKSIVLETERFNAARGFVGGTTMMINLVNGLKKSFNAARDFVGGTTKRYLNLDSLLRVSMPHAALWVVQLFISNATVVSVEVSMPHAALWVVQPIKS